MEPIEITGFEEEETGEMPNYPQNEGIDMNTIMYVLLGIFVIAFIIILYKAVKEKAKKVDHDESIGFEIREEEIVGHRVSTRKERRRNGKKPNNPIRRLVYDFEKKAAKVNLGRLRHESIENWFNRIGLEADLQLYQKVRYGYLNTSAEEEVELRSTLKKFEKELEKNRKGKSK